MWIWLCLIAGIILGVIIVLVVLGDVLRYRDLQRRLKAERERRAVQR